MKTVEQVYRELDGRDLEQIDILLNKGKRDKAEQYVRCRLGRGPAMSEAIVNLRAGSL